ncbi:MAG: guanylate kinase [Anaerovoracaceae bacterium]
MTQGRLFIISGPSAVGKGTIVRQLLESSDRVSLSVSATTRKPREGEEEGIHYYFLKDEEFQEKVEQNGFLEHAEVHGHRYGTPKAPVLEQLEQGRDVILEIDVQGAMQVKESFASGTYIFILPPSLEELRNRILNRGTESPEDVKLRMGKAMAEMAYLDRYDYYVVNDDLETAVETVRTIMKAQHQKIDDQAQALLNMYKGENE